MAKHPSDIPVQKIQAAVLRKRGGLLKIETLDMEGPRADEILVRLVASGICHTDIGFIDDWDGAAEPVILGHEGAGVVEEVGRGVKGVVPGDHVVMSYQSCGRCSPCRHGRPADCERFYEANFGFARLDGSNALWRSGVRGHFFGQSSFATHCLATKRNIVIVPRELPLELLAPLGCGLQTGAGTVMNSLRSPPAPVSPSSAPGQWAWRRSWRRASSAPGRSSAWTSSPGASNSPWSWGPPI